MLGVRLVPQCKMPFKSFFQSVVHRNLLMTFLITWGKLWMETYCTLEEEVGPS